MDIEPDWNVNAYMRAETVENRRRSVLTAFVIRMLGLSICSDTEARVSLGCGIAHQPLNRLHNSSIVLGVCPRRSCTSFLHDSLF